MYPTLDGEHQALLMSVGCSALVYFRVSDDYDYSPEIFASDSDNETATGLTLSYRDAALSNVVMRTRM